MVDDQHVPHVGAGGLAAQLVVRAVRQRGLRGGVWGCVGGWVDWVFEGRRVHWLLGGVAAQLGRQPRQVSGYFFLWGMSGFWRGCGERGEDRPPQLLDLCGRMQNVW
eukprot:362645-Chlamydomonas_euryale.AAC.6